LAVKVPVVMDIVAKQHGVTFMGHPVYVTSFCSLSVAVDVVLGFFFGFSL